MPIYDYRCPNCGEVVELLVRGSEAGNPLCPTCQGVVMVRLPSAGHLAHSRTSGASTCCGREERCATPPCSTGGGCCHG